VRYGRHSTALLHTLRAIVLALGGRAGRALSLRKGDSVSWSVTPAACPVAASHVRAVCQPNPSFWDVASGRDGKPAT
jgi:hypothetical protein